MPRPRSRLDFFGIAVVQLSGERRLVDVQPAELLELAEVSGQLQQLVAGEVEVRQGL